MRYKFNPSTEASLEVTINTIDVICPICNRNVRFPVPNSLIDYEELYNSTKKYFTTMLDSYHKENLTLKLQLKNYESKGINECKTVKG